MKRVVELVLGALLLVGLGKVAPAQEAPEPSSIHIRPSVGPEEQARRDAEGKRRWERIRREVEGWRRRWDPAFRPLRRTVEEALGSLRITWGPYSRNLGYAVLEEVARLRGQALLPAPDADLDARLRRALAELEQGADFCLRGMPTRAQLRWEQAIRRLEEALAPFAPGAAPRPEGPRRIKLVANGQRAQ
ncbi:MAG TPA: hypothetical protein VEL74_04065 [Thermoanaerobaculia bacterium]|nr:hypothetical protein [Thermoanaerobaculia bacterium]